MQRTTIRKLGIVCAGLALSGCESGTGPSVDSLPAALDSRAVGVIVEAGETGQSPAGQPQFSILIHTQPDEQYESCDAVRFTIAETSDLRIWVRDSDIGLWVSDAEDSEGTLDDLEVGRVARAWEDGGCFASCPGQCTAARVDVLVE